MTARPGPTRDERDFMTEEERADEMFARLLAEGERPGTRSEMQAEEYTAANQVRQIKANIRLEDSEAKREAWGLQLIDAEVRLDNATDALIRSEGEGAMRDFLASF